jgi:hypothetical protein
MDRECPHSIEAVNASLTPLQIRGKEHLGIGGSSKGVAQTP